MNKPVSAPRGILVLLFALSAVLLAVACSDGVKPEPAAISTALNSGSGGPLAAPDCSSLNTQCATGVWDGTKCVSQPKADGTTCNDGNLCTQTDACNAGACKGTNPVVCTRLDQCHKVGYCESGTGVCTNPEEDDGVDCNADNNGCTSPDKCQAGTCVAGPTGPCSEVDDQCNVGKCVSTGSFTHQCVKNPVPLNGASCNADSSGCTRDDTCVSGTCVAGATPDCSSADDQCNDGYCYSTSATTYTCRKNPAPHAGQACSADNSGCTQGDVCTNGVCAAGSPVSCTSLDDSCNRGTCTSTGEGQYECIKDPAPLEGRTCDADSNGCTSGDSCVSGSCVAGAPKDCSSLDSECAEGVCRSTGPATAVCERNSAPFEGNACNADNSGCTLNDSCVAGTCTAGSAPDCTAQNDTCNVGQCVSTGPNQYSCSKDPSPKEGAACDADSNGCSAGDRCVSGACTAGSPVDCSSTADQCNSGQCISTGAFSWQCAKSPDGFEGAACNADGSGCTVGDRCQSGTCVTGGAPDCSAASDACNVGVCRSTGIDSYECSKDGDPKNGFVCDADGDGCTLNDKCSDGTCRPGLAPDCSSVGDQCNAGVCSSTGPSTYVCTRDSSRLEGVGCNADSNGCTYNDKCSAGACIAGTAPDCSAMNGQCSVGTCSSRGANSFLCVKETAAFEGLDCNADNSGCTVHDKCVLGNCTAGTVPDCSSLGDECSAGVCTSTGVDSFRCESDPVPRNGTMCNADDNGCTENDVCLMGTCVPGAERDCSEFSDQCGTGRCTSTGFDTYSCVKDYQAFENTSCNADNSGCTQNDRCVSGNCTAGAAPDCTSESDQCNSGACSSTGLNTYACVKNPTPMQGRPCNADSNGCSQNDKCSAGTCVPGPEPDCSAKTDQCNVGVCSSTGSATYQCVKNPAPKNGAICNADNNGCTRNDVCVTGSCVAGATADCSSLTDQCSVGSCTSTGPDSYQCYRDTGTKNGLSCNADDDGCTQDDKCVAGNCTAGSGVNCSAVGDVCNAGVCNSTGPSTYQCVKDATLREGSACNADGNGCTVDDRCTGGVCTAGQSADCSALGGQCAIAKCVSLGDTGYNCIRDIVTREGQSCDADGTGCTIHDKCSLGNCVAGATASCGHLTSTCALGQCLSTGLDSFECIANPAPKEGVRCNADSNGCTRGDACLLGTCVAGTAVTCTNYTDQCNTAKCISTGNDTSNCVKDPVPKEGAACDADGSGCTIDDRCASGSCVAGSSPDCSAMSDTCNVGACSSTGLNSFACVKNPAPKEGVACDADGSGCTVDDACRSGTCTAGAAADCSSESDQCNSGLCTSTGTNTHSCSKDPSPKDGTACNADNDGCTAGDACVMGTCVAGIAPDCSTAEDQCNVGFCRATGPTTWECTKNPVPMEGFACNADSSGCTVHDSCKSGSCVAGPAADCSTLNTACATGRCESTGLDAFSCTADTASREGASCDADGSGCTTGDACASGACVAGSAVDCSSASDQCNAGYCKSTGPTTHQCMKNPAPLEGASCDADSSGCTIGDACVLGICVAGSAPDCTTLDDVCNVGKCSSTGPAAYECVRDPAPKQGFPCDADRNGCTVNDSCRSGACTAGPVPDCSGLADQCNVGTCSSTGPDSYLCGKDPLPMNGVGCNDSDPCSSGDVCSAGSCAGIDKTCDDGLACTTDACDAGTGKCVSTPVDLACADDNPCTDDSCSGTLGCVHDPVENWTACGPTDEACFDGACDTVAANDTCLTAAELTEGNPVDTPISGLHAFRVVAGSCAGGPAEGPDAFYAFTADPSKAYEITVTPDDGISVAISVLSGCGQTDVCIGGAKAGQKGRPVTAGFDGSGGVVIVQIVIVDDSGSGPDANISVVVDQTERPADDGPETVEQIPDSEPDAADSAAPDVAEPESDSIVTPDTYVESGTDVAVVDTATRDTATPDSGSDSVSVSDENGPDSGTDSGVRPSGGSGGCSAADERETGSDSAAAPLIVLLAAMLVLAIRHRRKYPCR